MGICVSKSDEDFAYDQHLLHATKAQSVEVKSDSARSDAGPPRRNAIDPDLVDRPLPADADTLWKCFQYVLCLAALGARAFATFAVGAYRLDANSAVSWRVLLSLRCIALHCIALYSGWG